MRYKTNKHLSFKTNKHLSFVKDYLKSYVYIYDGQKEIGMLCWDYKKKKGRFENVEEIK